MMAMKNNMKKYYITPKEKSFNKSFTSTEYQPYQYHDEGEQRTANNEQQLSSTSSNILSTDKRLENMELQLLQMNANLNLVINILQQKNREQSSSTTYLDDQNTLRYTYRTLEEFRLIILNEVTIESFISRPLKYVRDYFRFVVVWLS